MVWPICLVASAIKVNGGSLSILVSFLYLDFAMMSAALALGMVGINTSSPDPATVIFTDSTVCSLLALVLVVILMVFIFVIMLCCDSVAPIVDVELLHASQIV